MNKSPLHKISSSDSGSLSLGFRSPISIGGVLFNLERTTLQRQDNKHQSHTLHKLLWESAISGTRDVIPSVDESVRRPGQIHKRHFLWCVVWKRFSPADSAIEHAHDEHGESKMPGVAHGDKHSITVILQVPVRASGRVKHKTNLCPKRG